MIEAILLDWHGVLDKRTFNGMLKTMAAAYQREHQQEPYWAIEAMLKKRYYDLGFLYAAHALSPDVFWQTLTNDLGKIVAAAQTYLLGIELNQQVWQQLPALAQQYRLGILSDCPKDKAAIIQKSVDLSSFSATFFSCDYGLLKDDPAFFGIAIDALQVKPEHCLFIDDAEKNVVFAQSLGLRAVQYQDPLKLIEASLQKE